MDLLHATNSLLPLLHATLGSGKIPALYLYIPLTVQYLRLSSRNGLFSIPRWQHLPTFVAHMVALYFPATSAILGILSLACDIAVPLPKMTYLKGQYSVGYVDYEMLKTESGYPALGRILYPTQHSHTKTTSYLFQHNRHGLTRRFIETSGIWQFIPQIPSWLLGHWSQIQVPLSEGATPLNEKLPVVVFSHGNTASREISTSMGLSLASTGKAVVVLVEHTDGSSSSARFKAGTVLEFDHSVSKLWPDKSAPETKEFLQARRNQTKIRTKNIQDAIRLLYQMNQGNTNGNEHVRGTKGCSLPSFENQLLMKKIGLGGHSFGGATALNYAADLISGRISGVASTIQIGGLYVMDPANSWVPQEARLAVGLGKQPGYKHYWKSNITTGKSMELPTLSTRIPVMFMYSEGWWKVDKWSQFGKEFTKAASFAESVYIVIKGCGHQSLCDVAFLLPNAINVKLLKNTLVGTLSDDLPPVVNEVVLRFLTNVQILKGKKSKVNEVKGTMAGLTPDQTELTPPVDSFL